LVRSPGRGCASVTSNSDAPDSSHVISTLIRDSQLQERECLPGQRLAVWWSSRRNRRHGSPRPVQGEGEGEGLVDKLCRVLGFKPLTSILSPLRKGRGESNAAIHAVESPRR